MLRWFEERRGRPFLAFVHYWWTHVPYVSKPMTVPTWKKVTDALRQLALEIVTDKELPWEKTHGRESRRHGPGCLEYVFQHLISVKATVSDEVAAGALRLDRHRDRHRPGQVVAVRFGELPGATAVLEVGCYDQATDTVH